MFLVLFIVKAGYWTLNFLPRRHLKIKRPALEMLLQQIEQQPETIGLKRLLAVKKSLLEFEQRVEQVMKVVQHLMGDNKVRGWEKCED